MILSLISEYSIANKIIIMPTFIYFVDLKCCKFIRNNGLLY